jgi:hypothetical protein
VTARTLAGLAGVHEASASEAGIDLVVDDAGSLLPHIFEQATLAGAVVKTPSVEYSTKNRPRPRPVDK